MTQSSDPEETPADLADIKLADLITRAEFAEMLGITPSVLSSRLYRKRVPQPIRLGHSTMWQRSVATEFAETRKIAPDDAGEQPAGE